uniref:Lipoprotein n=1 Tax=uncultured Spirochaetaceae bacterium TaxID=201186 RepID=A0A650EPQ1_9SPIO|nr:lipoprotein [uncultured Spirochaetaceae bacterium]
MKKLILIFALVAFLVGCSKKEEQLSVEKQTEQNEQTERNERISLPSNEIFVDRVKILPNLHGNPQNSAHSVYLNDEVEFSNLPAAPEAEKLLVVGSDLCVLYENVPKNNDEIDSIKSTGIKIPKGTLLKCTGEKVKPEDSKYEGLFSFEDNYNYFYPVEYDGKMGFVFGADLCVQNITNEQAALLSFLYQHATNENTAYFENFYPICGYQKFDARIANSLKKNRVALQNVSQFEYKLDMERPDDMISLYKNHNKEPFGYSMGKNLVPLFITTDLFAHSQHLLFDRLLQHVEQKVFSPRLALLVEKFREKISDDLQKYPSNETAVMAEKYFAVASAILKLGPEVDDYGKETMPDKASVLSKYSEDIHAEIEKIFETSAMQNSSALVFSDGSSYIEDYTQYKPRGHYTQSEALKTYFRAMMWFGRINFPLPESSRDSTDASEMLARNMFKIGIYISDIIMQDESLYELWKSVFDPITVLIGKSDDLSFDDIVPLWKSVGSENVLEWISDENVTGFANLSREKLKSPLISSTSAFYANQGEGDYSDSESIKPAMGWRFLGQRFTYDAWIFQQVTSPRLYGRMMASGLDIASAFGSNSADEILENEIVKNGLGIAELRIENPDEKIEFRKEIFEKLKTTLYRFNYFFNSKDKNFWSETYYNSVLALIKAQAEFEQGAGFFFTETPLWNIKSLESSLGTWAELKHDTILYTKQSYAEMGGGAIEPTYRTDKLPSPVHYIEPNLKFFVELCASWKVFQNIFERYELFDDNSRMVVSSMEDICLRALKIVSTEAKDEKVSKDDLEWIATIPQLLAKSVVPFSNYFAVASNADQFRMALVADVMTNVESGEVLEVAVGIPHRMYVALNDKQGGKRIAVGYTFNYYEFAHPMNDRMTDEQWKNMVYENASEAKKRKPKWYFDSTIE